MMGFVMGLTKIDVAELAGVSHMTVTRALRNDACVSQEAKKRVMDACLALDYRYNMSAATVRGGRSFAFGVVLAKLKHTFYARFLDSLESECAKIGCHIITIQGVDKFYNMIGWDEIKFLLSRQVDGLFIMSSIQEEICRKIAAEKIPSIYLDVKPDVSGVNFIGTSDLAGFKTITDLIISKGHRKIAFIGGKKDSYTSRIRFQAFKESLKKHKIAFNEKLAAFAQNYDTHDGFSAAEALLLSGEKFTAVACANDYIAIGAISAFAKHGISVPGQISVTGYAGDEIGEFLVPPLTTVLQPAEEMAVRAVEEMQVLLKNGKSHFEDVLLDTKLIERGSLGSSKVLKC